MQAEDDNDLDQNNITYINHRFVIFTLCEKLSSVSGVYKTFFFLKMVDTR